MDVLSGALVLPGGQAALVGCRARGSASTGSRALPLLAGAVLAACCGQSCFAALWTLQVPPARILVISDDLEQATGRVKLQAKGGHGGHNGLRSIMERMGNTQEFPRIKIGIGRPAGQLPVAT